MLCSSCTTCKNNTKSLDLLFFLIFLLIEGTSQVAQLVNNLPANAGDTRDMSSIPWLGRSLGGENGNPLQYSCCGSPMDRGACRATVHGVSKSQT